MITLILILTALNTILILYFHWQQEERNISTIKSFQELNEKIDDIEAQTTSIHQATRTDEAQYATFEIEKDK